MGTEISERIEGSVDGTRVVSAYRAFAEEDKPYCISVEYGDLLLYATFQPSEPDDDYTVEEAEAANRLQINRWVEGLTELIEKADAWDSFVDDVEQVDCSLYPDEYYVGPNLVADPHFEMTASWEGRPVDLDQLTSWSVDKLDYNCTESVWVDTQGDHYKFEDDLWFIQASDDPYGEWLQIAPGSAYLTDFGPYTTTLADKQPRKVKQLNASEHDAEWMFTDDAGRVTRYKWDDDIEQWLAKNNDGRWNPIGGDGPMLRAHSGNYFQEITTKGKHE